MKPRISNLMLLLLLALVVVAYNYQFHNVPNSVYLNAYKLSQEKLVESRLTLPSTGIPHLYKDLTEDGDFRVQALDYVEASDTVRDVIKIPQHSSAEWWLRNASNSSQGYDMTLKFFSDSYFIQVRYYPDLTRAPLEHELLWTINIAAMIAWALFILKTALSH